MKILQQLPMWQSKMVYVNVKAKPSIIKEKTHVVQPFDSASYQVRCVAHGLPIPQISFYDDKDEILNDVQTQTFDDEKLREALVTVSDPNEYVQCIAKNQYAETSWKVNIPADVMFGNISEVQNLVKGVQGSIKIELTGDDLPNLKWEKFDKVNSRYNLILTYNKETKEVRYENDHRTEYNFDKRNGNLIIEQASTKDVTLFKATIQDWIKWRSKTIDVDVGVPATLIMDESHIIKPVGHKLFEIQCAGTGTPSLNIIFQDDKGSMIDKGGLTMSTYTFMKHSVVLRSSVLTSFVECIVKNKYGQDSLRIEIPNSVSFGDISTIQNLQSGTNGTIKVDIKTNKMPDTKWEKLDVTSKQYVEILSYKNPFKSVTYGDDSKANRYQFDEQHGHLIIKNVKPDDIGSYKISVNGNFGWISKIITINTNNPKSSMLGGSTIFGVSKILLGCIGGIKLLTITATIYFCCLKKRLNAHAQNEYEDVENLIQEKKEKKKKANDNDGLFESDKDEIKSGEDEIEFGENEIEVGDGEIEAGEGDDAYRRMHKEKETKASDRKDDDVTLRHFSEDQQDSKKKKRSKRHRSEPHSDLKDDDVTLRHSSDDQQHYKKKKRSKSHRSEPRSDNDNHERKKHGAENSSKNKKRSSEKSNNKEKRSRSRRHEDSHL